MTPTSAPSPDNDHRPGLVVVAQELTPYRLHFHRRIAREIPEFKLWTLLTYDSRLSLWSGLEHPEVNVVRFGEGEIESRRRGRLAAARVELHKASAIIRWLRTHRVGAILHVGYIEWPLLRPILWAHANAVPNIMWADANIRGDRVTGLRRFAKNLVVPRILSRCRAIMPCGSLGRQFFNRYGVRDDKIFLSPLEPDYREIQGLDPAVIADVRARYGLREGRRRLVVSGRLIALKCVDMTIDAFAAIAAERPEWDLVIAGDGPLRAELEARVPAALRSRVVFTGFLGKQEQVTAVYRCSDVLVHVSERDAWALTINEAAAAGLAIVATDVVGATAELVRDGVNGRLIGRYDRAGLVAALRNVTDPRNLNRMKAGSLEVLAQWRAVADPIDGLRKALVHAGALPSGHPAPAGRPALTPA